MTLKHKRNSFRFPLQINVIFPNSTLNSPVLWDKCLLKIALHSDGPWDRFIRFFFQALLKEKPILSHVLLQKQANQRHLLLRQTFFERNEELFKICCFLFFTVNLQLNIVSSGEKRQKNKAWMYGEKGIMIRQIVKPTWQNLFSTQMPQRSNYKLASSGINPPDSTLGLAIWQEIILAQIRGCAENSWR